MHVEVERGGQPLAADIRVQDLHAGEDACWAGGPGCLGAWRVALCFVWLRKKGKGALNTGQG